MAPFANNTANPGHWAAIGHNGGFQNVFAAHDPDVMVVDFDAVDNRANIGLAEGDFAGGQFVAHGLAKALDRCRAEINDRPHASFCAL